MSRGAVTFDQIDEYPPDGPISIEPPLEHLTATDYCWCQPRIEDVLPDGRIIIHRRTADGPE